MQRMDGFDPSAQILCVGDLPDSPIPAEIVPPGSDRKPLPFSRLYPNVRGLCARPAYGGSITAWSAGAYCASATNPPTILFQRVPPRGGDMSEGIKRIFLLCQHYCRCVTGDYADLLAEGRPAQQIEDYEDNEQLLILYQDSTLESSIISDPLPLRPALHSFYPAPVPAWGSPIPIYFAPEATSRRLGPSTRGTEAVTTIFIPPPPRYKAPLCDQDFIGANFGNPSASAQQMCAAEWFGGSKQGNAGFVCEQVHPSRPNYRIVAVSAVQQ